MEATSHVCQVVCTWRCWSCLRIGIITSVSASCLLGSELESTGILMCGFVPATLLLAHAPSVCCHTPCAIT